MGHPRDGWQGQSQKKTSNAVSHGVRNHAGMGFHRARRFDDGGMVEMPEQLSGPTDAPEQLSGPPEEMPEQLAGPGMEAPESTMPSAPPEQSKPGLADMDQDMANAGAKAGAAAALQDKVKAEGMTKNIERGKRFLASMDGPVGQGARSVMAMQESKAATKKLRDEEDSVSRAQKQAKGTAQREESESFGDAVSRSPAGQALGKMSRVVKDAFREFAPKDKK